MPPPTIRAVRVWVMTRPSQRASPSSPSSTLTLVTARRSFPTLALSPLRYTGERQPGGRRPAPGDLGLVQAFVNTFWDLDRRGERLVDAAALCSWLTERGLLDPGTRLTRVDLA